MASDRPRPWRKRFRNLGIVLLVLVVLAFIFLPGILEGQMNGIAATTRKAPSLRAKEFHKKLFVADMHADTLLWNRDLLKRSSRGHVDLPRLQQGNVGFQAFTIVTNAPRGMNNDRTDGNNLNLTTPLAILQLWPVRTWSSLTERTIYQCQKLDDAAARSQGNLMVIRTANDLKNFLERRKNAPSMVAGMLGVEGAHALDGKLENLDRVYDAGVRMMAPTHFFDNDLGGSAHGIEKGGLTPKGREWVKKMEQKKMIVDLAHASPKVIDDVLAMATRPVVVSHTGVRVTCGGLRNITDDQIRAISKTGGVICIGYFFAAVCGQDAKAIAKAIKHTVEIGGIDHVGLGSDYDGSVYTPFDTAHLDEITDALIEEGFSDEQIAKIMGGNILRVVQETLP